MQAFLSEIQDTMICWKDLLKANQWGAVTQVTNRLVTQIWEPRYATFWSFPFYSYLGDFTISIPMIQCAMIRWRWEEYMRKCSSVGLYQNRLFSGRAQFNKECTWKHPHICKFLICKCDSYKLFSHPCELLIQLVFWRFGQVLRDENLGHSRVGIRSITVVYRLIYSRSSPNFFCLRL